jgi:hypothetical protein
LCEHKREDAGGPANRRAEMWMRSKAWPRDPTGVDIPDSDSLQADACGLSYSYNSNSELLLRGVPSPDEWDAVALTFAEPVIVGKLAPIKYPDHQRWIVSSRRTAMLIPLPDEGACSWYVPRENEHSGREGSSDAQPRIY